MIPPLSRNIKADRGFHHERTGELLCPTGLDWNDPEYVHFFVLYICLVLFVSVKDKLKSGEMMVAGDEWPVFLYEAYRYDPEDPWKGLFRSSLLVTVCTLNMNAYHSYQLIFARLSSISSHRRVQFIRNLVPPALEMLAFTE